LAQLPSGVARRTVALRMRLKVARLAGQNDLALETARLLVKHKAFSEAAASSLVRALALEYLQNAREPEQLTAAWARLEDSEKNVPEVAIAAAGSLLRLGGDVRAAFEWLQPVWERLQNPAQGLTQDQKISLIQVLENGFSVAGADADMAWLSRIEKAQEANPGDAALQYLAGVACLHLQLWGKAQQLIRQALPRLEDSSLLTRAWQALAELAQQQGDEAQAMTAWKNAAKLPLRRRV
jgi:HemY protein